MHLDVSNLIPVPTVVLAFILAIYNGAGATAF